MIAILAIQESDEDEDINIPPFINDEVIPTTLSGDRLVLDRKESRRPDELRNPLKRLRIMHFGFFTHPIFDHRRPIRRNRFLNDQGSNHFHFHCRSFTRDIAPSEPGKVRTWYGFDLVAAADEVT